jgi:hypothetical protein
MVGHIDRDAPPPVPKSVVGWQSQIGRCYSPAIISLGFADPHREIVEYLFAVASPGPGDRPLPIGVRS